MGSCPAKKDAPSFLNTLMKLLLELFDLFMLILLS